MCAHYGRNMTAQAKIILKAWTEHAEVRTAIERTLSPASPESVHGHGRDYSGMQR